MNRRQFLTSGAALASVPLISSCSSRDYAIPPGLNPSRFGPNSTAMEVTEGMDLSGKTALITGCNSGIGYETMRVLAMRGAHVIGTGRTIEKATKACESVTGKTTPVALELSNFESVKACANSVKAMNLPIDILLCNAGYVEGGEQKWAYDLDLTFVINHLGHFILVNQLLEQVIAAEQGRVVMVSSFAALSDPVVEIAFDDLAFNTGYDSRYSYAHSKLANALFSLELSKRLQGTNATANALHPGVIRTNITRNLSGFEQWAFGLYADLFAKTIAQGAATSAYVATAPELNDVTGIFFNDCNPVVVNTPANNLYNQEMAKQLWDVSEELVAAYM